ncbi:MULTISPECIES: hypothetical protein [Microbacterium]|uniref:hypothetical protein n=1 Tax=Microbacterium TaxID=33882 RepID=UPI00278016C8|nr:MULTISPECIES: hypothetical protein [Microbacterium]MDQ1077215.1 hypothetical protein [Microbacterium sp. SORGH_AS_0969]MDQ1117459.1 hypothetical protein [Microbacterium testaceum]
MTNHTANGGRPPFAAYGPASAGYGPSAPAIAPPVAVPSAAGAPAAWPGPAVLARGSASTTGPGGARPPRRGLGIAALVIACVGTIAAFTASPVSWLLLVTALVLAIVHLARRSGAQVPAVIAIVIVGFGVFIALIAAVVSGFTSAGSGVDSAPDPETDTYTLAQRLSLPPGRGSESELAWGTAQTVIDSDTGDDVWSIRTLAPIDITSETATASPAPFSASGSLVATPVEITNLTDETIDSDAWQLRFSTSYRLSDGTYADAAYDPAVTDLYPSRYDITDVAPGATVTFYVVHDGSIAEADEGSVEVGLYSGDIITWTATGG